MPRLLTPIRTYPLISFTILACLFGWMFQIIALAQGQSASGQLPLGPIMAAAVVAACLGRQGLAAWWASLRRVSAAPVWWVVAWVAPVGLALASVLINGVLGAPLPTAEQLAGWTVLPGIFLSMFLFVGIGEEAGWTAFATPRLLARHGFLIAFALIAAMRIIWHLPLMLSGSLPWMVGIVANAGFQLLVLWVFVRSGGNWLLAALWHSVHNVLSGSFFFPMVSGADQHRLGVVLTVVYWLAAGIVLLLDRRRLVAAWTAGGARPAEAAVAAVPRRV